MRLRIGVDVGGTFTDFAAIDLDSGNNFNSKVRSTPDDPSIAILEGTAALLQEAGSSGESTVFFGHGTTVVTNMVVERKGTPLAVIATRGFRDVLELGRQARPHVYDYTVRRAQPLARRRNRLEVDERVAADGTVVRPLDLAEIDAVAEAIRERGLGAVAICFLHAYRNPAHEALAASRIRAALPGVFVTASYETASEYREFERFSTTALNAFVGPRAMQYFERLESGLEKLNIKSRPYTVTSNGGLIDSKSASTVPVRTALSGPAAGVTGIGRILARHNLGDLITFDVGGTSTDIAAVEGGRPRHVRAGEVAGHPILAPMVDIEVIGSGGGSLARIDEGGALTVGPESAGADPGPVAYGRGGSIPTLTDALLVLGHLDPDIRLGGSLAIHIDKAREAIAENIADPLEIDVEAAAAGILAIATANMARTIRSFATARGIEPERLSLVAYGGAGPLLAVGVAAELGMSRVIVPSAPGTLCARALLVSDIARDFSVTRVAPLDDEFWGDICAAFAGMEAEGQSWLEAESVPPEDHRFDRVLEARYAGQNFEIAIPFAAAESATETRNRFDMAHEREQGFSLPERPVDCVTYRLKAHAHPVGSEFNGSEISAKETTASGGRRIWLAGKWHSAKVFDRASLGAGAKIAGPAVLNEVTATTLIPPNWQCEVLDDGTISIVPQLEGEE